MALCRAQARPCRGLGRDTIAVSHALFWSQYTAVYCDTKAQQSDPLMSRYNYLYRDLHSLPDCTPRLQYNLVSCNTVPQPTTHPKAMSRYNFPLYRDTVLGSSPNQFLHFFFSVFSHIFFFSSSFLLLETPKKYRSIFFFPHSPVHQINL